MKWAMGSGFKQAAGDSWIAKDPWWNGRPVIRLLLREDGVVMPTMDARPFCPPPPPRRRQCNRRREECACGTISEQDHSWNTLDA